MRKNNYIKIAFLAGVILTLAFVLCACNLFQSVKDAESEQSGAGPSNGSHAYVTIECLSLIEPEIYSKVPANFKKYIPEDGYILKKKEVELVEGDTAYSILYRTCQNEKIDIRASYKALYNGYYVESINFLQEKMMDNIIGGYSGWKYKVNDVEPNYGVGNYNVKNLDNLVYFYIC